MKHKAILILENEKIFKGYALGSRGQTIGEVCFNTSMTGYQEILTDPSYFGQIITMTYPQIGNYGVNLEDIESDRVQAAGFIIKEESVIFSNHRAVDSLNNYLNNNNIVGIQGIDTRMLTRILRSEGAMNGIISSQNLNETILLNKIKQFKSMKGQDLAKSVTCKKPYLFNKKNQQYKISVIDFGVKLSILQQLMSYDCQIKVFPANSSEKEILENNPDGVFLSNGPGDPEAVTYGIKTVKNILGKKPIFGICLGHQILALALGGKTFKLKFGHRGCNHPIKNIKNNKIEITSQNHGFAVDPDSLNNNIEITHISLNDQTVEGLQCKDLSAFSIQYHPESSPGPHDSRYLFQKFINMMSQNKVNV